MEINKYTVLFEFVNGKVQRHTFDGISETDLYSEFVASTDGWIEIRCEYGVQYFKLDNITRIKISKVE